MLLFFDWSWITTTLTNTWMVILSAIGIYAALILFTRLAGLRSFSKMSSFDFATTVAFGSILGSAVLTKNPPLLQAVTALGSLFVMQFVLSKMRLVPGALGQSVDNDPILVMAGSEILHDNLDKASMTKADLQAKLREANVITWEQVRAVVVETTGDVSVLHAGADGPALDPDLLSDVRHSKHIDPV